MLRLFPIILPWKILVMKSLCLKVCSKREVLLLFIVAIRFLLVSAFPEYIFVSLFSVQLSLVILLRNHISAPSKRRVSSFRGVQLSQWKKYYSITVFDIPSEDMISAVGFVSVTACSSIIMNASAVSALRTVRRPEEFHSCCLQGTRHSESYSSVRTTRSTSLRGPVCSWNWDADIFKSAWCAKTFLICFDNNIYYREKRLQQTPLIRRDNFYRGV